MDILPVEGSDEGLVQLGHYGTRDLIALVLGDLDLCNSLFNLLKVPEKDDQYLSRLVNILGLLVEKIVEFPITWDELHDSSSASIPWVGFQLLSNWGENARDTEPQRHIVLTWHSASRSVVVLSSTF